jgi:hypothetical protein
MMKNEIMIGATARRRERERIIIVKPYNNAEERIII